jgi:hypothetical protein
MYFISHPTPDTLFTNHKTGTNSTYSTLKYKNCPLEFLTGET